LIIALYLLSNVPAVKSKLVQFYDQYHAKRQQDFVNSPIVNNVQIKNRTAKLFESMEEVIAKIGGPILDIGCGAGNNVSFYPSNTKMCTIDLNDHFKPYLMENLKSSKAKLDRYEIGNVEDMSNIFADNTFSCVVSTKLLCCVDQEKTLREITRVLKPGGRFYFLEHILEKPYTLTWLLQILWTPIWKRLVLNCHADQATDKVLEKFGFENFEMAIWYRPLPARFSLFSKSCIGFGDKAL